MYRPLMWETRHAIWKTWLRSRLKNKLKGLPGQRSTNLQVPRCRITLPLSVEFNTDVVVDVALQKVKDAVDKAKKDLPTDLTQEPNVQEVSFSEFPIMFVNISGDFDLLKLKEFADDMQDKLEELPQITRVDIVGAPEREFQINVDNYKMQAANITFDDIANAVARENVDISGGLLEVGNMKRTLQVKGQFKNAFDIEKIIVRNTSGSPIYLKDIADIKDTVKERESYARLNGKNVVTLNIIKRAGENLIETSDGVKKAVEEMKGTIIPKNLNVVITGDLSKATRTSFNDLVNSIVIGFILVLIDPDVFYGCDQCILCGTVCTTEYVCGLSVFAGCRADNRLECYAKFYGVVCPAVWAWDYCG